MLAALFLVATAQAVAAPAAPSRDVVVKARPLATYKSDPDACIARHCPPKNEIAASLAYAQARLLAGDYAGSRSTLLKVRRRNARFAADLPVDVSDLHHATARVADLNGRPAGNRSNRHARRGQRAQGRAAGRRFARHGGPPARRR